MKDQAELMAVSYADHPDLTYGTDEEMEKAWRLLAGLALGMASVRYIEALLYQVGPTELTMFTVPTLTILAAALLAAAPAVFRAVRIDPVDMLRSE